MKQGKSSAVKKTEQQGAHVLLGATIAFLIKNGISETLIHDFILNKRYRVRRMVSSRRFRSAVEAYEEMGMIMSTWFTKPKFLDELGQPARLSVGRGHRSFNALVRSSRVNVTTSVAMQLLRQSSSVKVDDNGYLVATRRAFFLPEFSIPRATVIMERFLNTLSRNSAKKNGANSLLLERCCYVSGISARRIAPLMRDIRASGSAFMDSVDGEIEGIRTYTPARDSMCEVGVFTFAWSRYRNGQSPISGTKEKRK